MKYRLRNRYTQVEYVFENSDDARDKALEVMEISEFESVRISVAEDGTIVHDLGDGKWFIYEGN